jgi:hypothetical protein
MERESEQESEREKKIWREKTGSGGEMKSEQVR